MKNQRPARPDLTVEVGLDWRAAIDDFVQGLTWSPDGKHLAACSVSGPISVFAPDGTTLQQWPGHGFGTTAIAWSRNGSRLASTGQDTWIHAYDPVLPEPVWEATVGTGWGEAVAWSPVDDVVAVAAGRTFALLDGDGAAIRTEDGHSSTISDIAWEPHGRRVSLAHYGGMSLWPVDPAKPGKSVNWKGSTLKLAWSPDGAFIATGDQDSTVHFWETRTGKELQMWGHPTKVLQLAWDRSSRYLATGGGPTVVVWDCSGKGSENSKPAMLDRHQENLSVIAFRPDGQMIASACEGGRLCLWDRKRNAKPVFTALASELLDEMLVDREPSAIAQLAWNPDGRRLAVGLADGAIAVVNVP